MLWQRKQFCLAILNPFCTAVAYALGPRGAITAKTVFSLRNSRRTTPHGICGVSECDRILKLGVKFACEIMYGPMLWPWPSESFGQASGGLPLISKTSSGWCAAMYACE